MNSELQLSGSCPLSELSPAMHTSGRPDAPMSTGTTVVFTPHLFSSCSLRSLELILLPDAVGGDLHVYHSLYTVLFVHRYNVELVLHRLLLSLNLEVLQDLSLVIHHNMGSWASVCWLLLCLHQAAAIFFRSHILHLFPS